MSHSILRKTSAPLATGMTLGLALVLGGCAGITNMDNRSLYSVKQPVVERSNYVLDVATDYDGLPISEQQRVSAWFESMELRYGDRVSIDDPGNSTPAREDVAALAGRYGLLLADGAPMTGGGISPGRARIVLTRSTASVPGCPDWSHTAEWNGNNATNPNYGCAMNGNLAAMIADPEDLIQGKQGSGDTYVTTSTRAIATYRDPVANAPAPSAEVATVNTKGD